MKPCLQRNNNTYDANSQKKRKTKQKYCIKVTFNLEWVLQEIPFKMKMKEKTFSDKLTRQTDLLEELLKDKFQKEGK